MSLKKQTLNGVKWTSGSMVIETILQFAQISILARFLEPADFGLMAIMMVVIGFSQAFQDMGLSNAIIQRQKVSHIQLSSLYWVNIASGVVLSLITITISPFVANFYNEPRITNMMALLSSVFILVAIGNQYRVLCRKEMDFRTLETINVFSAIVALLVAIFSALNNLGVLALVYARLARAGVSSSILLWIGLRHYHKPLFVYQHSELKGFYGFGLFQMGERAINYLGANVDKVIIGKLLGTDMVGIYNLAWQLVIFPLRKINPVVNKVAFPAFSKLQDDFVTISRFYIFNVKALMLITMPLLAFLHFFSNEIVLVLFGDKWTVTAEIITPLAIVGISKALGNPGGALILARGRADIGFYWNIFYFIFLSSTLFVGLIISPSINDAAYILLGVSISIGTIWHVLISRVGKISYWPIVKYMMQLFIVVIAIGWFGFFLTELAELDNPLGRIVTGGGISGLLYSIYLLLFQKTMFNTIRS